MNEINLRPRSLDFLAGGGVMGALMRSHDWTASPLGDPASWPQSLRSVVGLLLNSKFPMFVAWGPELGFLYNDAYLEILGAKHPQALGRRFQEIWEEIWPDILPLIDSALQGEATFHENLSLRMNRRGYDEQTWFTFSYSPVRDESGRIAGMFCACTETTEQVTAQRAISESEARFRNMADHAPVMMWVTDPTGYCTYLNTRWYEFTGQAPGSGEGYGWLEAVHPDDRPIAEAAFVSANAARKDYRVDFRVRRADGAYRWVIDAAAARFAAEGEYLGYVGSVIDIDERREVEDALRGVNEYLEDRVAKALAERKLLADLVEGTDAFVQVADTEFRWLAINKAAANEFDQIFGVRPRVGESMLALLADKPEHQEAVRAVWARALAGEEFTEVGEFGEPSRERRHYEMKFNVLRGPSGEQIGAYQFVYDVTQRVREQAALAQAQEALRQTQKMESLGQLTGGVAHDINNLLTPITGTLDLMARRYGESDPRTARLLDGALQSAERARILVSRLLGFARRQALQTQPVDVASLLDGMRDLIRSSIGGSIELRLTPPAALPAALADPNQLELAILNLTVNARDAMPNGGVLGIALQHVEIGVDSATVKPGDYVCISVIDSGCGMDPDTLAKAVEPFYSTKEVGKGTGLGLSMVHGLAAQLGGAFVLTSTVGRGTRADLFLPLSDEPAQPSKPAASVAVRFLKPLTILLVDDEDLVRSGTAEMLREMGHRVHEANSGQQALQLVKSSAEFDAVVTDYVMPGLSGAELADRIRETLPAMPILVVTGYAGGDLDLDLPQLAKPFRQNDLAAALERLLDAPAETPVKVLGE